MLISEVLKMFYGLQLTVSSHSRFHVRFATLIRSYTYQSKNLVDNIGGLVDNILFTCA